MKTIRVDLAPGLPHTATVDSFLQEIKEFSSVLSCFMFNNNMPTCMYSVVDKNDNHIP